MPPSSPLPPISSRGPVVSKPDMRICKVCGQRYDMRDLRHAYHHTEEAHEPLSADPKQAPSD